MQLGDHLGFAGAILGLLLFAVPYFWPNKRWIAYLALFIAFLLCVFWFALARHMAKALLPVNHQENGVTVQGDQKTTGAGSPIINGTGNKTSIKVGGK
jgi:hypothetical protein